MTNNHKMVHGFLIGYKLATEPGKLNMKIHNGRCKVN